MSISKNWLCLVFCTWAATALAAENVQQVTKRLLGFDLASVPFGASLKNHPEFTPLPQQFSVSALPTNIVWCSGKAPAGWSAAVYYGFLDGHLYCLDLATNSVDLTSVPSNVSPAEQERLRQESEDRRKTKQAALDKLRDDLKAASTQFRADHPAGGTTFDDGNYSLEYSSFCSSLENFALNITITQSQEAMRRRLLVLPVWQY